MRTRSATPNDVPAMSRVLLAIIAHTGRQRPSDEAFVLSAYVSNPASLRCTVATDEADRVLGFQSLIRAEAGNRYDVPPGWGVIGTHVDPQAHRLGVGKALFKSSLEAARQAGLDQIDAYISADNPGALTYYEAMGFRTYRLRDGVVQKAFALGAGS